MDCKYILICDTYTDGTKRRTGYGIAVLDRESVTISTAHDLSPDESEVTELVKMCNRLKLSPIHLQDVIEDFLT